MPVQKRPFETTTPSPSRAMEEENADDSFQGGENYSRRQTETTCDSDDSPYSSSGEKEEFIVVKLGDIRKEVQCPICLGIIRKTRTVMECLHRFCRECIDKSMRLGNNECPACRTHCASRRSLRDDPNYDSLIAALYPDIDKYEEEELAFHEEEKARNKQIQASIAQTFRRQAEALGKKRALGKVSAAAFDRKQGSSRNLRGRRNHVVEHLDSDEEGGGNGNDGSKDSSSTDERSPEVKSKRQRRAGVARSSQKNANGDFHDNDSEALGASHGPLGRSEIVAWGRGGMRSNTRHAGLSWSSIKLSRSDRLPSLVARLQCLNDNEDLLKISLTLVALLEDKMPPLKRPYLCCSPRLSVRHLCQYVAMQTSMEASNMELLIVKDFHLVKNTSNTQDYPIVLNLCNNDLKLLGEHQTLGEIHSCYLQRNLANLILHIQGLAYRRKSYNTRN